MSDEYKAIDRVVNIWTAEALSHRPGWTDEFFVGKVKGKHDSAEEGYHLWGTPWMMKFGDLPTGGYFWRPAYLNHRAFACEFGGIALGRTDSKLYNHSRYNSRSTPEANANRSEARVYQRDPLLYKWAFSKYHNHRHEEHHHHHHRD